MLALLKSSRTVAKKVSSMKFTVFGATGATGEHLVKMAVDGGHTIIAVEREFPDKWQSHDRIKKFEADVLTDDLTDAVAGSDVVLSALGIAKSPMVMLDPPALYTEGALKIAQAMKATKVDKVICISAAFADPDIKVPLWFRGSTMVAMNRIFSQIADMERVFLAADFTTTFVRPGWLLDLPFSDDYQ
ncbi:MAG: NAD(P)H-binding protein, partial [Parasphingorhabdus sp.]